MNCDLKTEVPHRTVTYLCRYTRGFTHNPLLDIGFSENSLVSFNCIRTVSGDSWVKPNISAAAAAASHLKDELQQSAPASRLNPADLPDWLSFTTTTEEKKEKNTVFTSHFCRLNGINEIRNEVL